MPLEDSVLRRSTRSRVSPSLCTAKLPTAQTLVLRTAVMPVICIGPVCVPTNLLLPFLIGALHRYGYLQW